jgi:hypothetical protein
MRTLSGKNRKALKSKMAEVFGDKIETMPCELQDILLDDLITAFENRLDVLSQAQSSLHYVVRFGMSVSHETIQT